jgi:hypothetical protein
LISKNGRRKRIARDKKIKRNQRREFVERIVRSSGVNSFLLISAQDPEEALRFALDKLARDDDQGSGAGKIILQKLLKFVYHPYLCRPN